MKKIFVFILAAGLFTVSCNNKGKGGSNDGKEVEKDDYLSGKKDKGDNYDDKGSSEWSSGDIRKFNSECQKSLENENVDQGVIDKVCPCVLGKVSNKYSSYSDVEEKSSETAIANMTKDCISDLGLANDGNNNNSDNDNSGGGWSQSDKEQWMKVCKNEVSQLDPGVQHSYCECILGKLESKFKDMDEVNRKGTDQMGVELGKKCLRELGVDNNP